MNLRVNIGILAVLMLGLSSYWEAMSPDRLCTQLLQFNLKSS